MLLHLDISSTAFQLTALYFFTHYMCGICYLSFEHKLTSCSHKYDYTAYWDYPDTFSFSSACCFMSNMSAFVCIFCNHGPATGFWFLLSGQSRLSAWVFLSVHKFYKSVDFQYRRAVLMGRMYYFLCLHWGSVCFYLFHTMDWVSLDASQKRWNLSTIMIFCS